MIKSFQILGYCAGMPTAGNNVSCIILSTNKYDINGYFIGFTKECYSTYCLDNGSFFSDKIEYAWGGQETELQDRLWNKGLKTFIVTSCWIDHIKLRKYQIGKQITDELYLK